MLKTLKLVFVVVAAAGYPAFSAPPDTLDHFPNYRVQGGTPTFYKVIQETIAYPRSAHNSGTVGTAIVSLTLDPSGTLTDIQIVNSLGKDIDEELRSAFKETEDIWLADSLEKNELIMFIPVTFIIDGSSFLRTNYEADFMLEDIRVVAYGGRTGRVREDNYHAQKAVDFHKKENYQRAIQHLDELIRRDPFNRELYLMRGLSHYKLNNHTAACHDYQQIKTLLHQSIPEAAEILCR